MAQAAAADKFAAAHELCLSNASGDWFDGPVLRRLAALLLLLNLALRPDRAGATAIVPMSLDELARGSRAVVRGVVIDVHSQFLPDQRIVTTTRLTVEQVIAGVAPAEIILIERGGQVGDEIEVVFGAPHYLLGEDVLVFVDPSGEHTTQQELGRFPVVVDRAHATDSALGALVVIPAGVLAPQPVLPLNEVVDTIRAALSGRRHLLAPAALSPDFEAPFTLAQPISRIFEADLGVAVAFRVDQRGDSRLGVAASSRVASAALEAWTAVEDASLSLENAGLTNQLSTSCPGTDGQPWKIRFDDPDNDIPDPAAGSCNPVAGTCDVGALREGLAQCSVDADCLTGMLARGAFRANTSETKVIDGVTYNRIRCASVTFANGWGGSAVWDECNLGEIATHELGHAIGFAHSSERQPEPNTLLRDATMYFKAHFDGRCASLKSDDMDAAAFDYPLPVPVSSLLPDVLPAATSGEPYSLGLSASGGMPPYTWTLERSDYCGLKVVPSGNLEGTPSGCLCRSRSVAVPPTPAPSPFLFIKVTDSAQDSHTRFVHLPYSGSTPGTALPSCTPTATRSATGSPTSSPTPSSSPTTSVSPTITQTTAPTETPPASETPTPSLTPTSPVATLSPSPTLTPTHRPCSGDCDNSGEVTIDELLQLVNLALETGTVACTNGDTNHDGAITVDEILIAVNIALSSCP